MFEILLYSLSTLTVLTVLAVIIFMIYSSITEQKLAEELREMLKGFDNIKKFEEEIK